MEPVAKWNSRMPTIPDTARIIELLNVDSPFISFIGIEQVVLITNDNIQALRHIFGTVPPKSISLNYDVCVYENAIGHNFLIVVGLA